VNREQARKWIALRTQAHILEGMAEDDARAKALTEFRALEGVDTEVRSAIEAEAKDGTPKGETESRSDDVTVRIVVGEKAAKVAAADAKPEAETRSKDEDAEGPKKDPAKDEDPKPETEARSFSIKAEDLKPVADKAARQAIADALRRPDDPLAAIAAGLNVRTRRFEPDELLAEVVHRTVVPQLAGHQPTAQQLQEVHNMLRDHLPSFRSLDDAGVETRALTIEANGTVIYNELARLFVVKPSDEAIFRNHVRSIPMGNTKKREWPRFDRSGMAFAWNRASGAALGSGDPTTDKNFSIEVTNLDGQVTVDDSFSLFNAAGAQFVSQYLLPEMRGAAQNTEDEAFFLGTGAAPYPATFTGLHDLTGVTAVTASTDGDAFTETILNNMLRAMPSKYRRNPARLAFYVPIGIGDDYAEIVAGRVTSLGDRYFGGAAGQTQTITGPTPVGYYRGIPIYPVWHLPQDETQGGSSNASTLYLVNRDIPVIGDALQIRIEPYRLQGFQTALQLQEWVGLGYQWPDAIVRRPGVLPKA
jgi:HK97 family phage major capsid protein